MMLRQPSEKPDCEDFWTLTSPTWTRTQRLSSKLQQYIHGSRPSSCSRRVHGVFAERYSPGSAASSLRRKKGGRPSGEAPPSAQLQIGASGGGALARASERATMERGQSWALMTVESDQV